MIQYTLHTTAPNYDLFHFSFPDKDIINNLVTMSIIIYCPRKGWLIRRNRSNKNNYQYNQYHNEDVNLENWPLDWAWRGTAGLNFSCIDGKCCLVFWQSYKVHDVSQHGPGPLPKLFLPAPEGSGPAPQSLEVYCSRWRVQRCLPVLGVGSYFSHRRLKFYRCFKEITYTHSEHTTEILHYNHTRFTFCISLAISTRSIVLALLVRYGLTSWYPPGVLFVSTRLAVK